jgi:hypothetical protein
MTTDAITLAEQAGFPVTDYGSGPFIDDGVTTQMIDALVKLVRNAALEEAKQAAQPDDAYQDEWFKAKADACRRINLLKEQG